MKSHQASPPQIPIYFFILSSIFWIICFWGFVSNQITLASDALAYQEHFQYYTDQLAKGIYPLWEPVRMMGMPFEFFLRRIGSFNPMASIIILLKLANVPFTHAYLVFLTTYFLVGMAGFFLLARRVLKDDVAAFTAYLLLMFSSLGTRLFDSYILFTVIPMIWFFYFLTAFAGEFKLRDFWGIIFTLMLLFTTYIPFFFITTFFIVIIVLAFFYWADCIRFFKGLIKFADRNRLAVALGLAVFLLSLVPGIMLFMDAEKGDIVLTQRHYLESAEENSFTVNYQTISQWGIEEDIFYSAAFNDLRKFKFAILYIPGFIYTLLLFGLFIALNKRTVFLFVLGLVFLLMFTAQLPLYPKLFNLIFYFKFFRNLHFFLWMSILPIFVLFAAAQMSKLLENSPQQGRPKILFIFFIIGIHLAALIGVIAAGKPLVSTYVTTLLSLLFFICYFGKFFMITSKQAIAFLFLLIVLQPLEVYQYLQKNEVKRNGDYLYENRDYLSFYLPARGPDHSPGERLRRLRQGPVDVSSLYVSNPYFTFLYSNLRVNVFEYLDGYRLIAYDRVERIADKDIDVRRIDDAFLSDENVAFIPSDSPKSVYEDKTKEDASLYNHVVTQSSPEVKVLGLKPNGLKVQTNFPAARFLVYHDNYHKEWQVKVDGQKTDLYRANVSFKGVWVPPGAHTVEFYFGAARRHALNWGLLIIFYLIFIWLITMSVKEIFSKRQGHDGQE